MKAGAALLGLIVLFPLSTARLRFIQLTTPLSVSAEKSHPPYIAFAETERHADLDEWDMMEKYPSQPLTTEMAEVSSSNPVILAGDEVLHLEPMKITKAEVVAADETRMLASSSEAEAEIIPPQSQEEVALAAPRSAWSERARQLLSENATKLESPANIIIGSGTDASGQVIQPVRDRSTVEVLQVAAQDLEIKGDFRLSGIGYASDPVNDHRFEVLRRQEGIVQERGEVNVRDNSYRIHVQGRGGEVVVRLRDKKNHLVGEAAFRLSNYAMNKGQIRGPELILTNREDVIGVASLAYDQGTRTRAIAGLSGDAFSGATSVSTTKNGDFEVNNVHRGSFTLLSMQAKDHEKSLSLVPAGIRSKIPLFPKSMIASLKEIVSEQRQMNLNDPAAPVIWGRVELNGKTLAGVQVEAESAAGLAPVYFNQFLMPDASLSATSENGLYAFVGIPAGFHALLARRGEAYFAHQNVVTEVGAVSVADLSSRIKTDQVIFRSFDAFTMEPRAVHLSHQGVEEEIEIPSSGVTHVLLPEEHRMSLARIVPEEPYAAATYITDDSSSYAHFPLVRGDWLSALKAQMRLDDDPYASTVVGFVPDQGFTAEAAVPGNRARVIYFDAQGRPAMKGEAGGGFVIFGLAPGVREVMVFGETTGRVFTQVIAADPQALNVLSFRAD